MGVLRLAVRALLAASSHKFIDIVYNEHIRKNLRQKATLIYLDAQFGCIISVYIYIYIYTLYATFS